MQDSIGNTYRGNGNGILTGPLSLPGGPANDRDIHENVFLENPPPGVYRVSVQATAVREDNHKETGQVDADFALAIRGIGGGRDTSGMVVDMISNTPGQFDVSLANLPGGWVRGFTVMSFNTSRNVSLGDGFGLGFDALSNSIILQAPSAGNVFAFTNSANPADYPNATWSFPSGVANQLQGFTIDAVVVLLNADGDIVDVSNVDRVTIQ